MPAGRRIPSFSDDRLHTCPLVTCASGVPGRSLRYHGSHSAACSLWNEVGEGDPVCVRKGFRTLGLLQIFANLEAALTSLRIFTWCGCREPARFRSFRLLADLGIWDTACSAASTFGAPVCWVLPNRRSPVPLLHITADQCHHVFRRRGSVGTAAKIRHIETCSTRKEEAEDVRRWRLPGLDAAGQD